MPGPLPVSRPSVVSALPRETGHREIFNKAPEITAFFWIIKVLATTVGETAAQLLSRDAGLGRTPAFLLVAVAAVLALGVQFRTARYVAWIYWPCVLLLGVLGTLLAGIMVGPLDLEPPVASAMLAALLSTVFGLWYVAEGTLSIHAILTPRRQTFYWLAVLLAFALGTIAGDLVTDALDLRFGPALALFGILVGLVYVGYRSHAIAAVLGFWAAFVLTRPLGEAAGDLLAQARGGLGLGALETSAIFSVVIAVLVTYLSISGTDLEPLREDMRA
ncbi:COG4705 family protein [Brevirhabdus sp.]|uniref:COG4705 family protein n=1 Tax=Brevirhabdus sp. TaxID=2004514 RepID=UPI004059B40E